MKNLILLAAVLIGALIPLVSAAGGGFVTGDIVANGTNSLNRVRRRWRVDTAWPEPWDPHRPRVLFGRGREVNIVRQRGSKTVTVNAAAFFMRTYSAASVHFAFWQAERDLQIRVQNTNGTVQGFDLTGEADGSLFKHWFRAFAILEYEETNGQDGFQRTDDVTGWYNLNRYNVPWKPFRWTNKTFSVDGNTYLGHTFTAETADSVFQMDLTLTGFTGAVDNHWISPDAAKLSFTIRWFDNADFPAGNKSRNPWTGATGCGPNAFCPRYSTGPSSSPTARVALVSAVAARSTRFDVRTRKQIGAGDADLGNPSVEFPGEGGAVNGYFSWDQECLVNSSGNGVRGRRVITFEGAETDTFGGALESSEIAGEITTGWKARVMVFSFNETRPSTVFWDPELGADVDYAAVDAMSDALALRAPMMLAAVLMLLYAIFNV